MHETVAITGWGVLCSSGSDVASFEAALRSGRSSFVTALPQTEACPTLGAFLDDRAFASRLEPWRQRLPDRVARAIRAAGRAPFPVQVAVAVALEAWDRAGLEGQQVASERIAVVVGGSNLTTAYREAHRLKWEQTPEFLLPTYGIHWLDTDHVGVLSEVFEARGEGFTVGGASASGAAALVKAAQLIAAGEADQCLVVGALMDLTPMELRGFYNLGALGGRRFRAEPDRACRPFDALHEGFVFGQGCACLVLEARSAALMRGRQPQAELAGWALTLDGNRLADPSEEGELRTMAAAIRRAGIPLEEIDYVNAHGTSSPLGDQTEVRALSRLFGPHLQNVWVNSTKGITGHCLSAAGAVETVATLIQLEGRFVHPNLNLEQPIDSACRFAPSQAVEADLRVALKNSFGFGGINVSLVFRKSCAS